MLGEDLVVEILKQLPVKSLYRCMCVCKSWKTLIMTPYFISTHLNHQKTISNGETYCSLYYAWVKLFPHLNSKFRLYVYCDDGLTFSDLPGFDCDAVFDNVCPIRVAGCCDGMVFLYMSSILSNKLCGLWNPSQKKYLELDFPFDNREAQPYFCGFGFDAYHNDYKVFMSAKSSFRSIERVKGSSYVCYVYSLKMRYWKRKTVPFSLPCEAMISLRGAHLEGVIHWAVTRFGTSNVLPLFSIYTFNLADETFGQITLPEEIVSGRSNEWLHMLVYGPKIINVHGKECLSVYQTDATFSFFCQWVMGKYGVAESWRPLPALKISLYGGINRLDYVRRNGEIVVMTEGCSLLSIDPKSEKCELITHHLPLDYAGAYIESLVSIRPFQKGDLEQTEGLRGD